MDLANGNYAAPLSIHTSGGVPEALEGFLEALEPHLPWKTDDYCVSLQLEGASAVWAAIDLCLQVLHLETGNRSRVKVAVGATSYHGPPATSFGAKAPLWTKEHQVKYPVPTPTMDATDDEMLFQFELFLDEHAADVGVILFEPQWGSSQAGLPWRRSLLSRYIEAARARGIKIVCDEIMCGLGRHGQGTLFVSEAWELNPDAVTFGKAIGGGVYPLAGAVLKEGRGLLNVNKATVMQSHTYAGSSVRALMTATAVLNEMPMWLPSLAKVGEEMELIFHHLNNVADGLIVCNGQGLMWGGLFSEKGQCADKEYRDKCVAAFKRHCEDVGVLPYHVPVGGFMVSPVMDVDIASIYTIGDLLETVIRRTKAEVGWDGAHKDIIKVIDQLTIEQFAAKLSAKDQCLPAFHKTRSCTSCASFVCRDARTRFTKV